MREYLRYETEVLLLDKATLERHELMLKHVPRWLDDTAFNEAARKRPVLTRYVLKAGYVDRGELCETGLKRICRQTQLDMKA